MWRIVGGLIVKEALCPLSPGAPHLNMSFLPDPGVSGYLNGTIGGGQGERDHWWGFNLDKGRLSRCQGRSANRMFPAFACCYFRHAGQRQRVGGNKAK